MMYLSRVTFIIALDYCLYYLSVQSFLRVYRIEDGKWHYQLPYATDSGYARDKSIPFGILGAINKVEENILDELEKNLGNALIEATRMALQ